MSKTIDLMSSPASKNLIARPSERSDEHQRFLGFTIGDSLSALIPLINLQATIKISLAEILAVPQMNESLLGIINYGGKATWVLDLAHLMGGTGYVRTAARTGMGMLFQVQNETVALLIERVGTIETYDLQQCLPMGEAMYTDRIRSFLAGYFIDDAHQSRVVIDLDRIVDALIGTPVTA
ncbi:chemotaxis protein CheW [Chamaesiphon sp. OTE_20_metabat_361]|uniref:chemotaxis protein CheW n=1 Tax=Chamaesiphon sp. OTE_20_metabat_361 TaxID=2964689 RepID=UPI00286B3513|nr:chemotaxis protein CheW [Chamaesiphon sp. OTE_20_metabat_361]